MEISNTAWNDFYLKYLMCIEMSVVKLSKIHNIYQKYGSKNSPDKGFRWLLVNLHGSDKIKSLVSL